LHGSKDPEHMDVKALLPADWIPASLPGRQVGLRLQLKGRMAYLPFNNTPLLCIFSI
jgi:hypothetical protein